MENLWPNQKSPWDDKFSHNEVSSLGLYVMRVWFLDFTTVHYDPATSFLFHRQRQLMDLTAEPKARMDLPV